MVLKGKLAELIVQIDPQMYQKYVTTSSMGEPMLYICIYKALYGLLQSALLFYRKLRTESFYYLYSILNGYLVLPYMFMIKLLVS